MQKGILRRNTRQRNVILEELKKTKLHPTADLLFRMVRRRISSIGFGTVYRNLNFLRDEGKILELACGKYSCHYDGDTRNHYHFFCLGCKGVFDLEIPILEKLDRQVAEKTAMTVKYHRIDFYGYCKKCKPRTTESAGSKAMVRGKK